MRLEASSRVRVFEKHPLILPVMAFLLLGCSAARNVLSPGVAPWLGELSLTAGVALAAGYGWRTGLVSLVTAWVVLSGELGFTSGRAVGETLEKAVILAAVAVASKGIQRYQRSEEKMRALLASMDDRSRGNEEALHESEERFQLLARATNDAVWDLDFATNKVWRGEGYLTLFGYTPDTIASKPEAWEALIHPEDRERTYRSFRQAIDAGQPSWCEEYRLRRADGTYANVLDRGYIVRDDAARPTRMVGAVMDTTERKQSAEQLAQARRMNSLGRIAASIAHEFNNVLMGIQPNLEVVRLRTPDDLSKPIDHIFQAVRRGKRVTDEILRFTRPSEPTLQCVAVDPFLTTWAQETRSVLGENVELIVDVREAGLYIGADPLQIAQVLTNVAINARDAMTGRRGELRVTVDIGKSFGQFDFGTVKTPDRYVHFRVSDEGIGMTSEELGHVFEPLFTTKSSGTGLGLAVSYQLVKRHDGMIFAESELGRGTTFHILLPTASPLVEVNRDLPNFVSTDLQRVLIVEDESAVAAGIGALLELQGIQVDLVSLGAAAIPAIERHLPDAVVLDIGLPDMSGVDVYSRIAVRWPDLPIVFSSGHADPARLEEYLRKPNVGLLAKPYEFDDLMQVLGKIASVATLKSVACG
jgi:PAS domain S-box-containing protein